MTRYTWKPPAIEKDSRWRKEINRTLVTTILNAQFERQKKKKIENFEIIATKFFYDRINEVNDLNFKIILDEREDIDRILLCDGVEMFAEITQ
jgi:hypothetical protein